MYMYVRNGGGGPARGGVWAKIGGITCEIALRMSPRWLKSLDFSSVMLSLAGTICLA